jgi:DNA polymerase-3 subunit epsilon
VGFLRSLFRRARPWDSVVYWALDLETGGLRPGRDPILSVGMVPIRGGTVRLGEAFRTLVRPPRSLAIDPESIRVHHLVPDEVAAAPRLAEVLPEITRRVHEGVLLVHYGAVDLPFLARAYRSSGWIWQAPPVVDTKDLLLRWARVVLPETPHDRLPLNLASARRAFGLPDYGAHDALADAVSTAELFLVLRHELGARTIRHLR